MKDKNKGMLVFPVIMRKDMTTYDDVAHGIFFEDTSEGFDYMEEMDKKNDESKYCYWSNILINFKKNKIATLEVFTIEYTEELIDSINKYNTNLESISKKILDLKVNYNNKDIEMSNLHELLGKLSVINSAKSRKETEELLRNVIHEYGYMLEVLVRGEK